MKKILIILTLVFVFFVSTSTSFAATLILSPASGSISAGQTITVDIMIDTKGADIDGVDVYSLRYNSSILEVVDSNPSTSGVQISPGSLFPLTLTNKVTPGIIQLSQVTSGGTSYKGAGKLATITFKGVANGTSAVTFDFTAGSTSDTNVAGGGVDKLTSVAGGSYTVSGGNNVPPPPPVVDTTAPIISGISSSGIKSSSANIVWTTDENSDSVVEYGPTTSYGSISNSASLLTLHARTLTNLKPNTLYHYRVKSKDAAGNIVVSSDNTFKTLVGTPNPTPTPTPTPSPTPTPTPAPRPTPTPSPTPSTSSGLAPKISTIYASPISATTATVTWRTDVPATSQIEYGNTDSYGSETIIDSDLVTSHSVTLTGLSPLTTYHYRVKSKNDTGNLSFSLNKTLTTIKDIDSSKNIFERFMDWILSFFV